MMRSDAHISTTDPLRVRTVTMPSPSTTTPTSAAGAPHATITIGPFLAHVRAAGGNVDALREEFGLPASAEFDPVATMPLDRLYAFQQAAAARAFEPLIGVRVAVAQRSTAARLMEMAAAGKTLGETLQRYMGYLSTLQMRVAVTLTCEETTAILSMRVAGWPEALGRHVNEYLVTALVLAARRLTGDRFVPTRLFFAHANRSSAAEIARITRCERIVFGEGANVIAFDRAALSWPLANGQSAYPPLVTTGDRLLGAEVPRPSVEDLVRDAVARELPSGPPSIAHVGRLLGRSSRSLQRDLAARGASFQGLVDEARLAAARTMLEARKLSITEIAVALGYAYPSTFLRAFRRWTGTTPRKFRLNGPAAET